LGYGDLSEDEDEDDYDEEMRKGSEEDDLGLGKRKQPAEDEDEDLGGWGPSKKDYYNADAIETEQDALDEEAEARRIQKKQLEAMTEADFGFDESEWLGQADDKEAASKKVVTEVLPQLQITDDMTEEEKLKILHSRYPEFEPIRQDFLRLQSIHEELKAAADAAERLSKGRSGQNDSVLKPKPNAVIKYWACASYLGAICMYFAILTSPAKDDGVALAIDPAELHQHPVMETLLKCQKVWARVEDLPLDDPTAEAMEEDEPSATEEAQPTPDPSAKLEARKRAKKEQQAKKTKAERAAALAQAEADARRAAKLRKTEQDLADLASLTDKAALRKSLKQKKKAATAPEQPLLNLLDADDSDFGEETALTAAELAEKAKKKKSLRFYTSQITQKASKRGAAGKDQGGDADIPHRERLKDRQARLQAEAERRGQNKDKQPGVLLGEDGDSDDDNEERGAASRKDTAAAKADGDDDYEDYYDMVAARNKAKKAEKAERAAAYAQAAKENAVVVPEEVIGEDGKRKINYLIAKNKVCLPPFLAPPLPRSSLSMSKTKICRLRLESGMWNPC
jgi:U3 small nucleolar RNA-associated protein 3